MEQYLDTSRWEPVIKPTRLGQLHGKAIIVYKVARYGPWRAHLRAIVTLRIAHNTRRQQSKNYKCRAASAKVIEIRSQQTGRKLNKAVSFHRDTFIYRTGETVRPVFPYDPRPRECASGIHFFLTIEEARSYN